MSQSDEDDLILITDSTSNEETKEYPTDTELDQTVRRFVENEVIAGLDPKDMKLKDVIMVIHYILFTYYIYILLLREWNELVIRAVLWSHIL